MRWQHASARNPPNHIKKRQIHKTKKKKKNLLKFLTCKKPIKSHQKKTNPQNEKKPFKISNLPKTDSQKKLLDYSITPKVIFLYYFMFFQLIL